MIDLSEEIVTANLAVPSPLKPSLLRLYQKTLAALDCGTIIVAIEPSQITTIECNPAFERITGYNYQDAIGRGLDYWLVANENDRLLTPLQAAIAQGKETQICCYFTRGDRHKIWLELKLIPIEAESGAVTHFIILLESIEPPPEERPQQEFLYRTLARNLPNGIVLLFDRDCRYILAEGQGLKTSNLSKTEIEGKTLQEVFPPQVVQTFEGAYRAALQGDSQTCEYEHNGRSFLVHVVPTQDERGEICGGMVTAQDITEQKQTERCLRSLAEREKLVGELANRIRQSLDLDSVLNTAVSEVRKLLNCDRVLLYRFNPDWSGTVAVESFKLGITSILDIDLKDECFRETFVPLYQQGRIRAIDDVYANNLTPCHLGMLETMQVRANLVVPILHEEQLWGLLIAHHCTASRTWETTEIELLQQLSVQLAIAIRQAANAEKLQAELSERARAQVKLKEALHELKRTQAQLIQHEKMSSLGQMVAGIAHEINNPISFIAGNIAYAAEYARGLLELIALYRQSYPQADATIQAALDDLDYEFISADFPKLLESMKLGTERIRQIVLSLRNFSRLDEAERKSVNLHEGLENTLAILKSRLYRSTCPIEVIKDYADLPLVECYPSQLNQVFMSVIENAIDALEAAKQENPDLIPQLHFTTHLDCSKAEAPRAVIRIKDNGIGIPEDIQSSIFDPFFSSKPVGQGTGLGLSISYQIVVQKHQGQLDYTSTPGQGTEFAIAIPLQA